MKRLSIESRLPQKIPDITQYIDLLNIRLGELFRSIVTQINNGADGFLTAVKTVTTDYTVLQSDQIIFVNNTVNCVITIPKGTDTQDKIITVKKISNNAATVTLTPASGNIDGAASKVISAYLTSHQLASDGANYWIL